MRIKWWTLPGAAAGAENCIGALLYFSLGPLVSLQKTFHVLLTRLQRETALIRTHTCVRLGCMIRLQFGINTKVCMLNGPLFVMATRLKLQILLFLLLAPLRFSVPAVR